MGGAGCRGSWGGCGRGGGVASAAAAVAAVAVAVAVAAVAAAVAAVAAAAAVVVASAAAAASAAVAVVAVAVAAVAVAAAAAVVAAAASAAIAAVAVAAVAAAAVAAAAVAVAAASAVAAAVAACDPLERSSTWAVSCVGRGGGGSGGGGGGLYSPGTVSFACGSTANTSVCTAPCALSSLSCSPRSAGAVEGGSCLPWGAPTFSATRSCPSVSFLPCFTPANLSLSSPSPLRVRDVAGSRAGLSCSDVTWQLLSCAWLCGCGLPEMGKSGCEGGDW